MPQPPPMMPSPPPFMVPPMGMPPPPPYMAPPPPPLLPPQPSPNAGAQLLQRLKDGQTKVGGSGDAAGEPDFANMTPEMKAEFAAFLAERKAKQAGGR